MHLIFDFVMHGFKAGEHEHANEYAVPLAHRLQTYFLQMRIRLDRTANTRVLLLQLHLMKQILSVVCTNTKDALLPVLPLVEKNISVFIEQPGYIEKLQSIFFKFPFSEWLD